MIQQIIVLIGFGWVKRNVGVNPIESENFGITLVTLFTDKDISWEETAYKMCKEI